jgi:hypothetical protein
MVCTGRIDVLPYFPRNRKRLSGFGFYGLRPGYQALISWFRSDYLVIASFTELEAHAVNPNIFKAHPLDLVNLTSGYFAGMHVRLRGNSGTHAGGKDYRQWYHRCNQQGKGYKKFNDCVTAVAADINAAFFPHLHPSLLATLAVPAQRKDIRFPNAGHKSKTLFVYRQKGEKN